MNKKAGRAKPGAVIWSVAAAALAAGVLFMTFRHMDIERLPGVLAEGQAGWLIILAVSIPLEQVVRGWKWRQILFDIRPVGAFRLFGAVMAGYFANMVAPVGVSPLVRAWLVARLEGIAVATVLLTTAIERFVDGIVFALIVGVLIFFAALPASEDNLRLGLMVAGGGSLVLFSGLFVVLFLFKKRLAHSDTLTGRFIDWLEKAFDGRFDGLGRGMAAGIIWPGSRLRGLAVIAASVVMKLISTTHFLWAGLAFGILLSPLEYLLVMVISGFALIITRFVRLPGGGIIGSAFALKLLGVADEEALTMVLVVHATSLIMTAGIGGLAIWKSGLTVFNLRQHLNQTEGRAA
jgi:glycosyltransferase 2 family protein